MTTELQLRDDVISAFLNCKYKAHLKATGHAGKVTDYEIVQHNRDARFQQQAVERLKKLHEVNRTAIRPPSLRAVFGGVCTLVLDAISLPEAPCLTFEAIEISPEQKASRREAVVLQFVSSNKLSQHHKVRAAVYGIALSRLCGCRVVKAAIVHGSDYSRTNVMLVTGKGRTRLATLAGRLLDEITSHKVPQMILNRHCDVCEFQERCLQEARQRDDLSLLRGLRQGEIETFFRRGIMTVTQLAHSFRAKMARSDRVLKRHLPSLQAAAIRDKTVYVRCEPQLPTAPTSVFLDVEGDPDQDFYYLIGLLTDRGGHLTYTSLWSDSGDDERTAWNSLRSLIDGLGDFVLFYYGRYEDDVLRRLSERYADTGFDVTAVLNRSADVHAAIRTNVYFPTHSNRLKDIASVLGASWPGPIRSGIESIAWRYKWEISRSDVLKQDLIDYNRHDCFALRQVVTFLSSLPNSQAEQIIPTHDAATLADHAPHRFGKQAFAIPELERVTRCAYFSYQRDKIFFRNSPKTHKRRRFRRSNGKFRVNQVVECTVPECCPECGSTEMTGNINRCQTKIIRDIRLLRGSVKRWTIRYSTGRHQCRVCGNTCYSDQYPTGGTTVGKNLEAWLAYGMVGLRQSFEDATQSANDIFGYSLSTSAATRAKKRVAAFHKETEERLLQHLLTSPALYVDETTISIKGKHGYVWAFANAEEVVYRFSDTREAGILSEVLGGFSGVVVSDFYGAYDSLKCSQQKCLVHLIRDINDDLLKGPFDVELKGLAERVTVLIKPIIDSIDRYGLKKRHLAKFIVPSEGYRTWLANQQYESLAAIRYQKRIGKYGDRLFTFLLHDGVAWNNNCAENAIKLVVGRRRIIGASFNQAGITDYLRLLSIYQTLRRKGASFLRFLMLGENDLLRFVSGKKPR